MHAGVPDGVISPARRQLGTPAFEEIYLWLSFSRIHFGKVFHNAEDRMIAPVVGPIARRRPSETTTALLLFSWPVISRRISTGMIYSLRRPANSGK